jgi:hypothetical protein
MPPCPADVDAIMMSLAETVLAASDTCRQHRRHRKARGRLDAADTRGATMRFLLPGLLLAAAASPAFASGGLDCSAEDKRVKLSVNSGVTHGMGGPTFNFHAELELYAKTVAEDLRRLSFDDRNRPQYWLDGKELRLLLYKEREADKPFGSVEVEIRTRAAGEPDEGTYKGSYKVAVYDGGEDGTGEGKIATFAGKVECFAE